MKKYPIATKARVKEYQYRLGLVAPYIEQLKDRGFNVPLEFGGYSRLSELLNYVIQCESPEFWQLLDDMSDVLSVFSYHEDNSWENQ